jgi:Domain of unknown function (DUF4123)
MSASTSSNAERDVEALLNLARAFAGAYVLVDRYDGDESAVWPDADSGIATCSRWPLLDPLFAKQPDRSPVLIQLEPTHPSQAALLDHAIRAAMDDARQQHPAPRRICAFVFSHAQPREIQRSLTERLNLRYDSGKSIYFRYFDPRVMPQLERILETVTHDAAGSFTTSALLGPVDRWCCFGRDGVLHILSNPSPAAQVTFARVAPRALSDAIDRIALVNAAATQHCAAAPEAVVGHVGHERDAELDAQLLRARALGLRQPDDLVCYAAHATRLGPTFVQHPRLAACLSTTLESGAPLADVLEQSLNAAP